MYFVYIIFSSKTNKFYTGSTDNLENRLKHHNSGSTPSTRSGSPFWEIKYYETHPTRSVALKRELEIKKKKSRKYLEWLIRSADLSIPLASGKVPEIHRDRLSVRIRFPAQKQVKNLPFLIIRDITKLKLVKV